MSISAQVRDLYNSTATNNGAGVRWEHAFAPDTPAMPANVSANAVVKPAVLQVDWVLAVRDGFLLLCALSVDLA